jgi:outer membrane protein
MQKKILSFILLSLINITFVSAQITSSSSIARETILTLQSCIEIAQQNNVQIKQNDLAVKTSQLTLDESKYNLYPTLNGGTGFNLYSGRNINPYTNGIINNTVGQNNFNLQAGVMVFDGKITKNTIELNKLALEAAGMDLQTMKNNISLQVAVAYLGILSQQDLLDVAQKQADVTKLQIERTQKFVDAGALPETNLFDLKAQLANDELSIVNSQNNLESAKLSLSQLLNFTDGRGYEVTRVIVPNPSISVYPNTPQEVYQTAISYLPEVKAAEIRKRATKTSLDIAKASKLPTITAGANWGTNYSTAAERIISTTEIEKRNFGNVDFNGTKVPLVVESPKTISEKISYPKQVTGNMNTSLGINMRIPIFNGYNNKFRIANAQIQGLQADLRIESTNLQLKQSIDQAYISLSNAAKRYTATQSQVSALEEAYRAASVRFEAGSLNSVDYNIAKTNLDRAKSNLIQTKYDYVFRVKILDFYQNKPLNF